MLAEFTVVAMTALVLGLLIYAGWLPALAAASIATFSVCAVTWPRASRIAAYAGLVALPFLTAWPLLRPDEFSYPIYFAAFTLALVGLGAFQPRMFTASAGTLYLAYISAAASIFVVGKYGFARLPEAAYVLAAFATYTLLRRADRRERLVLVYMIVMLGAVQSALAVLQTLFGWPVFDAVLPYLSASERNYFAYLLPGVTRLVTQGSGTFPHFNALGAVLSLCLPLVFGLWLLNRQSVLHLTFVGIVTAGVVTTFSRGALAGSLAGVLFVLWFGPTRSKRATLVLALCLAMLVALLGASVANQYFETTQNLTVRVQTWRTALDDALDEPATLIAGYGFGHFHEEVLRAGLGGQTSTRQSTFMASLHSGYVQLLLEFGVVGAVLFVAWMFAALRSVRRSATSIVAPVVGGALGILCSQALDNGLFSYAGVLFVALVAIAEGEAECQPGVDESPFAGTLRVAPDDGPASDAH